MIQRQIKLRLKSACVCFVVCLRGSIFGDASHKADHKGIFILEHGFPVAQQFVLVGDTRLKYCRNLNQAAAVFIQTPAFGVLCK